VKIITDNQRAAICDKLDQDWLVARATTPTERRTMVSVAEEKLTDYVVGGGKDYAKDRSWLVHEVSKDPEVKGFITLSLILMILAGWIIGKLLDYLWDSWTYNRSALE